MENVESLSLESSKLMIEELVYLLTQPASAFH